MRRLETAVLLGMALGAGGCGRVASPGPVPGGGTGAVEWRSLVGCWRMGDWRFAFDSVPVTPRHWRGRDDARQARTGPEVNPRFDEFWRVAPGDTVEFVMDNGLFGNRYLFVARGDSLVGLRHAISDAAGPPPPPQRAAAVRAPCG